MFGPESSPQHGFGENPVIGHLNLDDPEAKALFEEIEEGKREFRKRYPTTEGIAEYYQKGYLSIGEIQSNFSEQELAIIWKELEDLEESED